jgi:adenylate kinase
MEIKNAGSRLMIVDGFPRKLEEVERWEKLVGPPHHVISLHLDDKSVVNRLVNREVCDSCGASYNSFSNEFLRPIVPRIGGKCDLCTNGVLSKRADDSPDAIRRRLRIFRENERGILNAVRKFPHVELIECDATKGIAAFEQIAGRISNIYS